MDRQEILENKLTKIEDKLHTLGNDVTRVVTLLENVNSADGLSRCVEHRVKIASIEKRFNRFSGAVISFMVGAGLWVFRGFFK